MSSTVPLALKGRALLAAAVIPPLLSMVSFGRLCGWLERSRRPTVASSVDATALAAWVDRLLYALPGPWRHTCLKRSARRGSRSSCASAFTGSRPGRSLLMPG